MNVKILRYLITLLALAGIVVHIFWPSLAIDGITLTLLVVSIIPWLVVQHVNNAIFKLTFPEG